MRQLTQKLKDGRMRVLEVPLPVLDHGMILVQSHYSLISPGTERSTVFAAKKRLIGKAKERPQQVKQVIELTKNLGPIQTYRAVMKKLDSYSPLGYSSAGEVIEVASDVDGFCKNDLVACGGSGYANHAEIVAVPVNLCVKLPADADLKRSAYNTLGAIALQGVRQADTKIGETCAVIGLGLIGQLTALILRVGGVKVVGIDIDPAMIEIAKKHCADCAFTRKEAGLTENIIGFTDGIGIDSVIITASSKSLDPINLAGMIVRKKGRVVIVGNVPTGFERELYYKKEVELRMSCSYGPGRYDINYEEKGLDYPVGYVRWTENRNMKAFQELVYSGKINIDYLTTHIFKLEDAPKAYDVILERKEPFLGILIEYETKEADLKKKVFIEKEISKKAPDAVRIAFIGAGNYAMSYLLPHIAKENNVIMKGIMTSTGTSSRTVAEKYQFEFCTSNEDDIFKTNEINTVFIATRHNTHAEYVIKSIKSGKNIFVEKPLCINETELDEIIDVYTQANQVKIPNQQDQKGQILMVGFNRRFSSLAKALKKHVGEGPMAIIYRINASSIPADSWIQNKDIGGGRIIGEVCHFIDFLTFINGSVPVEVFAKSLPDPMNLDDTLSIIIRFKNGSIGTIAYYSNGSKSLFKEYIEVYKSGVTALLKDFKKLELYEKGRKFKKGLFFQDKGQKEMIRTYVDCVKRANPSPITFEEVCKVTRATFKTIESLQNNKNIRIE
ncbi:MAG: oxidoreductase [Candidatus Fischerbacteria bacterium RBG_13_37_8]|uniref:Oxidoreductase n=1 Tax=Candidatus Fischerbacteria bacterium RBG_13_37_8 TaxID=1817863 RepID=A0A1F5VZ02_9BACT|nr:MAG: oxidoreductase [Candidatus Fischerbacteria bacterium RBG_13_37_8]